ncbi:MAG: hypothetical protein EOO88_16230 [Pedobacter sp.]|nr:MAG: hypothetical protein EOO88_16230 [Pedobacter sp.]
MKLKSGKREIVYLLTRVFEKYEKSTGQEVVRNTNRKNYEDLARLLSQISNELPNTAESLQHDIYPQDTNPRKLEYPYLKYDITGGQIKDAYNGIVANPRHFLIDACYIYLFGVGRKGFEKNPVDSNLLETGANDEDINATLVTTRKKYAKERRRWRIAVLLLVGILIATISGWYTSAQRWSIVKSDLKILPYQPSDAEIKSLKGVWMVYIGSPQARVSDNNRYHTVVMNIVEVKFKDGYFTFNRYGASFNHIGYMQFERPGVVSIHSYIKNSGNMIESPRLSLMRIDGQNNKICVISASWNFDIGNRNDIIGIREVYVKQGDNGNVEEVMNTIENSSCRCKIVRWKRNQKNIYFYLRNEKIESLTDHSLQELLDEHSILLRQPDKGIVLTSDK